MTSRRYTISEMSETSNISKKALRFYDKLGLISPRLRGSNNYRYYTHEDVLSVPLTCPQKTGPPKKLV